MSHGDDGGSFFLKEEKEKGNENVRTTNIVNCIYVLRSM